MPKPAIRFPVLGAMLAMIGLALADEGASANGIILQPHRIAYEVGLGGKGGGAFSAARGLITLEFTGNACDGYVTNFRQATELADSDGRARALDFRVSLWEDGGGKSLRFVVNNKVNGQVTRDADGEASRVRDGSLSVAMKKPRGKRGDFDGAAIFPSAMMQKLVEAAQSGQRRYDTRLFDGSEGGEKIFDTSAMIGNPLEGERNARLEPVMRVPALDGVRRWPVAIAYFDDAPGDRVPVYTMRSVTFANGVVSDIVFEFPDFSLSARAIRYEELPAIPCRK